ncbi:serine hydrolase domain-containing protein [Pedobacter sp. KR3-3]|uniref:Serine hydrolase domain-containing protein n=1 Tax=Pedobacter albus TaxID=3113905 RepID=A0ABU7I411_9SPHI|nr:serine hydrolase domain-containing protein [Pedobacter sp. KR3-3]MEE1944208.1 serine hydrolase domain-containing protein [Pedobacter sp. KR3-3]
MNKITGLKYRPQGLFFLACFILFVFCTMAKTPDSSVAQISSTKDSVEVIIAQEVAKLMKQPGYTAVSGVIYLKGKAHHFHFGQLQNGKKPDNHTIYEIGSITKTYTGLLLAQAVSDHKIGLDDDVRTYLDGQYPNLVLSGGRPITFRHLITHTSGLPLHNNCYDGMATVAEQLDCFKNLTESDFFAALKNVKLVDNSGRNYHYSGVGTQLIGYILEHVYRLSYQDLFQKYIFSRSGEKETFSELTYNKDANISIGKDSIGRPMPLINGYYKYSAGMKSSTSAMLAYMKMYLESNDKVVRQAMNRLAGTAQYGRAYAWNTYNYDKEMKMLYHNGGSFGHSSWIALYPNQKVGIFIVTNVVMADSQVKLNELSNSIIDRIGIEGR